MAMARLSRRNCSESVARLIQAVREIALAHSPDGVGTVGEMAVSPNSRNTIPGEVFLTVDLRHPEDIELKNMADAFLRACQSVGSGEGAWLSPSDNGFRGGA